MFSHSRYVQFHLFCTKQGAFYEHERALQQLQPVCGSIDVLEIRKAADLDTVDGVIIPGGESTTMRIIGQCSQDRGDSLLGRLREVAESGTPIWGTCAGCILLSDHVSSSLGGGSNDHNVKLASVAAVHLYGDQHIGGMDINTCRNFFGRQTKSFETFCSSPVRAFERFPCVFIRAPAIVSVGPKATAVATVVHGGDVITVAAQQDNLLATCFHPELANDLRIHEYFVNMVTTQNRKS